MSSENSNSVSHNNMIECPYCICLFVSQFDLESHLKEYGTNKSEHLRALNTAHKLLDRSFRGSMSKGSKTSMKPNKSKFRPY